MEIMYPVGRLVGGDLYKLYPQLDDNKKPKVKADGTPVEHCNFGVAIPKAGETHWNQTPWGAMVAQVGQAAYPKESQLPQFAWKITDGDSTIPNRKGNKPSDNEHYRGCWVIWFSQSWLPKLCNHDGSVELTKEGLIKPGFFVRVLADVIGNNPSPSPGVYQNPKAVALMYEGEEIILASEVDTGAFAQQPAGAMPAGAKPVTAAVSSFGGHQMTPAANGVSYESYIAQGWNDALLIQHGMMLPPPATTVAPPPAAPPPAATVAPPPPAAPDPAFIAVAPPPAHQMTAKAGGISYEAYRASNWTDAQLIEQGYMLP